MNCKAVFVSQIPTRVGICVRPAGLFQLQKLQGLNK